MTNSKTHIEQLQERLDKVSSREQVLISALSQALARADKQLLDDVRTLTIEHETRRGLILSELQTLASRIGAFPASDKQLNLIEDEPLDLPYYDTPTPPQPPEPEVVEPEECQRGADWRQAAMNIRHELGLQMNGRKHNA